MPIGDAVTTYSLLTSATASSPRSRPCSCRSRRVSSSPGQPADSDLGSDVFGQFARQGSLDSLRRSRGDPDDVRARAAQVAVPRLRRRAHRPRPAPDQRRRRRAPPSIEDVRSRRPDRPSPQQLAIDARVEPLELDLAFDLIELVDGSVGGDLLDRVGALRRKIASELGFVMPSIRTRDDVDVARPRRTSCASTVSRSARGEAPPGRVLVIGDDLGGLPGDDIAEPVFGLPARWVPVEFRRRSRGRRATPSSTARRSSSPISPRSSAVGPASLLSRTDVKALLEGVGATDPAVIEDLTASGVSPAEVQRVLATLLDDGVAIRDLVRMIEAIGERARTNRSIDSLVDSARGAVGPAITSGFAHDGVLSLITFSPALEAQLADHLRGDRGRRSPADRTPAARRPQRRARTSSPRRGIEGPAGRRGVLGAAAGGARTHRAPARARRVGGLVLRDRRPPRRERRDQHRRPRPHRTPTSCRQRQPTRGTP